MRIDTSPAVWSLAGLEAVLRGCWDEHSVDPADPWEADNPARGHCSVTSLVVHELLGGELLCAEVTGPAGERIGLHYWNRLPCGLELDLTREQFRPGELVGEPTVQPVVFSPGARMAGRYDRYAERVRARLGGPLPRGIPGAPRPDR